MKAAFIIAAAGAAVAQNLSGIPTCATSCLSSAVTAAGCAPTDVGCQCGPSKAAIAGLVAPCLISACTAASDLISAQSGGEELCTEYSEGLTASATATTTGGSGEGSTTTAVSTTTSTGAVETTVTSGSETITTSAPVTTTQTQSNTIINGTVTTGRPSGTTGSGSESTGGSTAGAAPTGVAMGAGALLALLGAVAAL